MSEYKCMECIHGSVCGDFGGSHAKNCEYFLPESEWISVKERLPETDDLHLIIVNGKPKKNITLVQACELATYCPDEGWILEQYPEWETPEVTHWQPLPEPPKEVSK